MATLGGSRLSTLGCPGACTGVGLRWGGVRIRHELKRSQRLAMASSWATCRRQCTGDSTGHDLQSMDDLIFRGLRRHSDVVPEFNHVGDDLAFGVRLDELKAPVRIQGRTNVEAFISTEVPRAMGARLGMNEYTTTNWPERSLVEVEGALKVFPHGDPRVEVSLPE